jgi:hypothetical protein
LLQTIRRLDGGPLAFLVGIYDRRVKTTNDISTQLSFVSSTRASDGTTPHFAQIFKLRLERYQFDTLLHYRL